MRSNHENNAILLLLVISLAAGHANNNVTHTLKQINTQFNTLLNLSLLCSFESLKKTTCVSGVLPSQQPREHDLITLRNPALDKSAVPSYGC